MRSRACEWGGQPKRWTRGGKTIATVAIGLCAAPSKRRDISERTSSPSQNWRRPSSHAKPQGQPAWAVRSAAPHSPRRVRCYTHARHRSRQRLHCSAGGLTQGPTGAISSGAAACAAQASQRARSRKDGCAHPTPRRGRDRPHGPLSARPQNPTSLRQSPPHGADLNPASAPSKPELCTRAAPLCRTKPGRCERCDCTRPP